MVGWRRLALFCIAVAVAVPPLLAQWEAEGIYGLDDRREVHEVRSAPLRRLAGSTVALFQGEQVALSEDGTRASLKTEPFNQAPVRAPGFPWGVMMDLCEDEPYRGQGRGAFCSGSLVAEDVVLTAGHCVRSDGQCKDIKFVFGFHASEKGEAPESVPAGDVYGCGKLLANRLEMYGADYAVVRLDRPVEGRKPLRIRRHGAPPAGTPLVVIGHPVGLPAKVAGGASIRRNDSGGYFVGNLDTYGGNSGGAVFNAVTGEIEGILVRGGMDFVHDGERNCAASNRTMDDTGRGEDVTLVGEAAPFIPARGKGLTSSGRAMSTLRGIAEKLRSAAGLGD